MRAIGVLCCMMAAGCASLPRYRYRPALTAPGADIVAAFTLASGNEAVPGNSVQLLENGDGVFPAMLAAIRGAQSSVHLETFIFRDGAIGREIVAALAERARAGVHVRLLLDALGSMSFGSDNERTLAEAGARVIFFHPISLSTLKKVYLRTHRKVLIVDGRIGFTGGVCIDDDWLGNADRPERWRDTAVRVDGPVVRQMQIAFARAWLEATEEILSARALYPSDLPAGEITCQLMDSTPGFDSNPARLSFLVAVASAKRTIDITNAYFVPDHASREELVEAAKRGVRVRLLLPSRRTDFASVRYSGRSYYRRLLEAGVEIYEYEPCRLHAKTMVIDGHFSSVGSSNLDRRSFYWNYESDLQIFDARFAAQMEAMFESDLAHASRVNLEEWKHRPLREKILERLYSLFRWQY